MSSHTSITCLPSVGAGLLTLGAARFIPRLRKLFPTTAHQLAIGSLAALATFALSQVQRAPKVVEYENAGLIEALLDSRRIEKLGVQHLRITHVKPLTLKLFVLVRESLNYVDLFELELARETKPPEPQEGVVVQGRTVLIYPRVPACAKKLASRSESSS